MEKIRNSQLTIVVLSMTTIAILIVLIVFAAPMLPLLSGIFHVNNGLVILFVLIVATVFALIGAVALQAVGIFKFAKHSLSSKGISFHKTLATTLIVLSVLALSKMFSQLGNQGNTLTPALIVTVALLLDNGLWLYLLSHSDN